MFFTRRALLKNPLLAQRKKRNHQDDEIQRRIEGFQLSCAVAKGARALVAVNPPLSVIPGADSIVDGRHDWIREFGAMKLARCREFPLIIGLRFSKGKSLPHGPYNEPKTSFSLRLFRRRDGKGSRKHQSRRPKMLDLVRYRGTKHLRRGESRGPSRSDTLGKTFSLGIRRNGQEKYASRRSECANSGI